MWKTFNKKGSLLASLGRQLKVLGLPIIDKQLSYQSFSFYTFS